MITNFDPNSLGNPNNNLFGLPSSLENSELVILPVPWEVTVSYNAGTARSADAIHKASLQVDLFDEEYPNQWQRGIFIRATDKKVLLKSDYLRKEAELYISYISEGEALEKNAFMCKTLKEINEGSVFLNEWVYAETKALLQQGKLVALLGGDHSTPLGFFKAIAEKHADFGILQIDAHADLRKAFEDFNYSHASIMYNALEEIPQITKLVQVGIRDYCDEELNYITENKERISTFFDRDIKYSLYDGTTWKYIVEAIVAQLPEHVFISFDIDGLDPKLCPNTGTPVTGGFETAQIFYLFKKVIESGRIIIGFDLNEVGVSENEWDENVGARVLYKMCNLLLYSNQSK